ncbi:acyltransferase family protein [Marinigracilibium pacificum]|uniref:Heparan-alpha-glucosaminide N-acetyltransferase n=1 Tax=Marinigracilibium pacificum TaxID=2729599 RepID=A0A848IZ39_9BACT|nr:heparan-alpha-glucosaminide N-acetyltransferase [Marinigracilibium pacificum]NMM47484.1 heparan-alpha-glucosaminide N-acetyltransferase [Marinigracilibium pacificum]
MHKKERLLSLDVFRGLTIAAMIIVNNPGSWSHMYSPLQHAHWHGLTPTDLIFPFFLFIVGFSISYSLGNIAGEADLSIYKKILWRSAKIFIVGLFLWFIFKPDLSEMRWAGVLQRISICFFVASILFINLNIRSLIIISSIILIAYSIILLVIPVPIDEVIKEALATGKILRASGFEAVEIAKLSTDKIQPNLEPGTNIAAWIDRQFLPGIFYEKTWDPEGLLTTLPAIVTTLSGVIIAQKFKTSTQNSRIKFLSITGIILVILALILTPLIPLNKNLWSPSYVLITTGLASLTFLLCYFILDIKKVNSKIKIGQILGANAISAYVLSFLLIFLFYDDRFLGTSLNQDFMEGMKNLGVSLKLSSALYSILYIGIIFIPLYYLFRKKIFIKL